MTNQDKRELRKVLALLIDNQSTVRAVINNIQAIYDINPNSYASKLLASIIDNNATAIITIQEQLDTPNE